MPPSRMTFIVAWAKHSSVIGLRGGGFAAGSPANDHAARIAPSVRMPNLRFIKQVWIDRAARSKTLARTPGAFECPPGHGLRQPSSVFCFDARHLQPNRLGMDF